MPIGNVSAVKPVLAQAPKKEELEQKVAQAQKEIKDGKKKLALALAGLATVGVATIGTALAIKKGKMPSELTMDNFKKIGNFEKGKAFVKGKPYTGIIDVVNKNGKFQMEYVDGVLKSSTKLEKMSESFTELFKKMGLTGEEYKYVPKARKIYSKQDGVKTIEKQVSALKDKSSMEWKTFSKTTIQDDNVTKTFGEFQKVAQKQNDGTWKVTKQEKRLIGNRGYAIDTIDIKTGEVVDSKVAGIYNKPQKGNGGLLRKTVNEIDSEGNKTANTFKNGKLYSTTSTTIQPDGAKRIVVKYAKWSDKNGQTIIDIAPDGTRTVVQKAKNKLFEM